MNRWATIVIAILGWAQIGMTRETKNELRVLFVGSPDSERGRSYVSFLRNHFANVESMSRTSFDPKQSEGCDVVLLDWPQSERTAPEASPFGAKEAWGKPTVLLGSAGLLMAERWKVHGAYG